MYKNLLEYIVKNLVTYPEKIEIFEVETEEKIVLKLKVAKEDMGRIIGKEGRKPQTIFLLAECFYQINEFEQAKETIYEVIEKDPSNYKAYFLLGNILEKDDTENAIDMYKKCNI